MGRRDGDLKPNLGSSAIAPSGGVRRPFSQSELAWSLVSSFHLFFHLQRHTLASCSSQSFRIPIKVNLSKALFSWQFSGGFSEADRAHCAARHQVTFKGASNYQIDQRWKMALPHYPVRGRERWTVCGRYTTMFMVTVRCTLCLVCKAVF